MSALDRIAHSLGRRDEVPNQELARELAAQKDQAGIREIAENLWSKDKNVRADCLKVLYEIGYIDPALVAGYVEDFIRLLKSSNNRLVWGGMIALGTVASLQAGVIFSHLAEVQQAMKTGSVITVDNGVLTLALVAGADERYGREIFPGLLEHLKSCRPKEVAQHAEKTLPAVNAANKADFISVLQKRTDDLSGAALARVRKVIKEADRR